MLLSNRKRSKFIKSWPHMREKETNTSRANRKITGFMLHTFNICNMSMVHKYSTHTYSEKNFFNPNYLLLRRDMSKITPKG